MSSTGKANRRHLLSALNVATVVAASMLSACAARYRTIHKELGGQETPAPESEDATPKVALPTAGVEVLRGDSAVSKVGVDEDFVIRPTESTRDPDNADKPNCRNPGIVKADYQISDGSSPSAARAGASCTTLEVPHKISAPGTYTITLTVTSDENETATSSMTLVVVPKDQVDKPEVDGGFTVKANPPVAYPGDPIVFDGDCTNAKLISWAYGDGGVGTGVRNEHAYANPGQYKIDAECERPQGPKLSSSVTVTIIPKPTTPPGGDDGSVPPGDGGSAGDDGKDGDDAGDDSGPTDGGGAGDDGSPTDGGADQGTDDTDGSGSDDGKDDGATDGGSTDDGGTDDGDDDPPGGGNPGQNPGQTPNQSPHQN